MSRKYYTYYPLIDVTTDGSIMSAMTGVPTSEQLTKSGRPYLIRLAGCYGLQGLKNHAMPDEILCPLCGNPLRQLTSNSASLKYAVYDCVNCDKK